MHILLLAFSANIGRKPALPAVGVGNAKDAYTSANETTVCTTWQRETAKRDNMVAVVFIFIIIIVVVGLKVQITVPVTFSPESDSDIHVAGIERVKILLSNCKCLQISNSIFQSAAK